MIMLLSRGKEIPFRSLQGRRGDVKKAATSLKRQASSKSEKSSFKRQAMSCKKKLDEIWAPTRTLIRLQLAACSLQLAA
ncbi:hypothetical protein, partial [Pseudomonas lopnurensis]|uniref:hypothetical protein n=1 Tax=Pseudomonas lopnurensis TaxID=1477517 RepID=UPI0028B0E1F4